MPDLLDLARAVRKVGLANKYFNYKEKFASVVPSAQCFYVDGDGNGMCIIGKAMVDELDISPKYLLEVNNQSFSTTEILSLFGASPYDAGHNDPVRCWLKEVQWQQDRGASWGEAIKYADNEYGIIGE